MIDHSPPFPRRLVPTPISQSLVPVRPQPLTNASPPIPPCMPMPMPIPIQHPNIPIIQNNKISPPKTAMINQPKPPNQTHVTPSPRSVINKQKDDKYPPPPPPPNQKEKNPTLPYRTSPVKPDRGAPTQNARSRPRLTNIKRKNRKKISRQKPGTWEPPNPLSVLSGLGGWSGGERH